MLEPLFTAPTRQPRLASRKKTKPRKQPSQAAAPKRFEFISSGPVGKPDPNARKFIRSHVMRGKNTKRQGNASRRHQVPRREDPAPASRQGDAALVIVEAESGTQPSYDPNHDISADTFIQFQCLPGLFRVPCDLKLFSFAMPLDDISRNLIFRFLTTLKETMYPVEWCFQADPAKVCWFRWLLEDAGYLNAVFFIVSAFQDLLTMEAKARAPGIPWSQGFSPRTRTYLRQTIQKLQENLDDSERQLRDTTASTVISLALVADAAGDTRAFEAHMGGLKQMVKMRGGLRGFHNNKQLQVKLCRVDLGWSIKYGSKPDIYGGKVSWDPFLETALRRNPLVYPRSSSPAVRSLVESWDYKLKNVFNDARDFAYVANQLIPSHEKLPPELFQEIMLSIQYRILLLEYPVETQPLEESIRLGLLAFESTVFLQIPGVKIRSGVLSSQLREAIEKLNASSLVVADMKLWLLLVGSICVFEGSESWLVESINELTGEQTWPEVRMRIREVMWIDRIHDEPGKRAFETVQRARKL
ncbi:hypothetical protein B0T10DRAFT_96952 [Thelonectria olida]|uniref:Uncharacterized protein n=1 Tax=Thelonectria olida TaxID=1576542 RepID=A0A9P8VZG2_9HYPO|nr:hypothetical protein B0T10DRAFT_96952 [Thelonectria olida]